MPRWPASQGWGGGEKRRRTRGWPSSGQRQVGGEALAGRAGSWRTTVAEMTAARRDRRIGVAIDLVLWLVEGTAAVGWGW